MKSSSIAFLATTATFATVSIAKPPLQLAEAGVKVDPIRVAAVKAVNGRLEIVGDWVPYTGFAGRSSEECLFDCYGRRWGPGSTGEPAGGDTMACSSSFGLHADFRWHFGGTYHCPYAADDMTAWKSGRIEAINAGWWWLNDPAQNKHCYLAFLLSEDAMDTTCSRSPDTNVITGGIVLDLGDLRGSSSHYYWVDAAGLSALGLDMPTIQDGAASHLIVIAEDFRDGVLFLTSGPAQFMLWGAAAIRGDGLNGYGGQSRVGWDDDNPTDATFTTDPNECYDFANGNCPDPYGKMVSYGGLPACRPDVNADGFLTGDDFDRFVTDFEVGSGHADGGVGDYDGNGFVTGDDYDRFVADFLAGC